MKENKAGVKRIGKAVSGVGLGVVALDGAVRECLTEEVTFQ